MQIAGGFLYDETDRKIEYRQLMFAVACFLQAVSINISVAINNAGEASWIIVILSTVMGIVGGLLITGLCSIYGRQNLHGMLSLGVGKFFGTAIAVAYVCFFFWKLCDVILKFTSFIQIAVLPKTPSWLIQILLILVCCMAAKEVASVFCGMGFIFTVTTLFFSAISILMLIPKFELQNFLPMFSNSFSSYAESFFVSSADPFGEVVAFLMIMPFVKNENKNKKLAKALTWGVIIGAMTFLLGVLRDISVFGVFAKFFTFPSFESIRLIDLGEVFSRVEIIYIVLYTFLTFFKGTVWLFALSEMIKSIVYGNRKEVYKNNQSMQKKKQFNFVYFAAFMAFIATILGSDRVLNGIYMDFKVNIAVSWLFAYVIPTFLLLIGFIKMTVRLYRERKVVSD